MTVAISKDTQNNIKALLESGYSYSQIMSRIPNLKKTTLSYYANKFFPNRTRLPGGRKSLLPNTTKSYIRKQIIKGSLKSAKAVHKYLGGVGYKMTYSCVLKVLKSMNFHARIKKKKPLLAKRHMIARL
ncbi:uncharacterized protein BX663DRAFT_418306, partial [Cokeromyces recurvatus]|uniref:uncharacterized protein n=1 Tax=Cokeromyces recurvatus TaxID=90255 RepID=UPI002220A285